MATQRATEEEENAGEVLSSRMNADYQAPPPRSGGRAGGSGSGSGSGPGQVRYGNEEATRQANNLRNWEKLYEGLGGERTNSDATPTTMDFAEASAALVDLDTGEVLPSKVSDETLPSKVNSDLTSKANPAKESERAPYQLHGRYIVSPIKSGWLLIDQRASHQRILYEQFLRNLEVSPAASQRSLFPQTLELAHADVGVMKDLLPDLRQIGFDVDHFGGNAFIINGTPAEIAGQKNEKQVLESLLQQFQDDVDMAGRGHEALARALARSAAIRRGQPLDVAEMRSLINRLFGCEQPQIAPNGDKCFINYELSEVERLFSR